jgi:hypothetical protein
MSARLAFYLIPAPERRTLIEFIKNNYILVDVDGYAPGGSKDEVAWWLSVHGKGENNGCGNNAWYIATAGGQRLGDPVSRGLPELKRPRYQWKFLSEETRKPKLATPAPDSPKTARIAPPPGALIVRVYFNYLDTTDAGEQIPVQRTGWYTEVINQRFPGTDVMWVTEKEWKSMVPPAPKAGDKLVFPSTLQDRILRYYGAQELIGWNNTDYSIVRGAEFTLSVDEASDAGFRLKLEGFARKGKDFSEKDIAPRGGDFRFLGYLRYDARKKAFDRFDVVALGNGWGGGGEPINATGKGPQVEYVPLYRRPVRPYGVGLAFELVSGERQVDRVPPGPGANGYAGWGRDVYFGKQ